MAGTALVCLCLLAAVFNVGIAFGASSATNAVAPAVSASDALWQDARNALNTRKYPKARTLFNEFLKKFHADPRSVEAQICIGICDYHQGAVPRAVETWTRAVNMELLQKRRSAALLLGLEQLAAHWQKQNKHAELEKILAQMGELFPEEPATHQAHLRAATQRFDAGDYAEAAALYAHAGALSGKNAGNYQLSKELASAAGLNVRLLMDKATGLWESNEPGAAARLYEEALKRNLTAVEKLEAMTHLGWCLYLQKENDRAEKLWKAVIASAPQGDKWRGESRWRLVVLSAGVRNDRNKVRDLCAEQFSEFKGTFLGRQAKLTQAWLYMVDKQWSEAKRHFEELAATYSDQNNEQIAEYIADCESELMRK